MRVLLVGSGGREQALALNCRTSGHEVVLCSDAAAAVDHLASVDLVIPGPEAALVAGIATTCAAAGWSRRDVSSYLFQKARLPAAELKQAFKLRAWAPWMDRLTDDEAVPMTEHPDNIRMMVVGGPGKHSSVVPSWGMTRSVTVPLEEAGPPSC